MLIIKKNFGFLSTILFVFSIRTVISTTSTTVSNSLPVNPNPANLFPGSPNFVGGETLSLGAAGERRLTTLVSRMNDNSSIVNVNIENPISDAQDLHAFVNGLANSINTVDVENPRGVVNRELVFNLIRSETTDPVIIQSSSDSLFSATNALENGIRDWSSSSLSTIENYRHLLTQLNNPLFSYERYLLNSQRPVEEVVGIGSEYGLYELFFLLDEPVRAEITHFLSLISGHQFDAIYVVYLRLGYFLFRAISSRNLFRGSVNNFFSIITRLIRVSGMRRTAFNVNVRSRRFFAEAYITINSAVDSIQSVFSQRLRRLSYFDFVRRRPRISLALFMTIFTTFVGLIRNRYLFRYLMDWIFNNPTPGGSPSGPVSIPGDGLSARQHINRALKIIWDILFK